MAAAIGQTISVIDKSGKVVSTSKHLFSVFKEARSAYRERKTVIRNAEDAKKAERDTRRALAAYAIEDGHSTTSMRHLGRAKSVIRHHDDDRHSRHHSHHSHHTSRSQKRRSFEFELQSQYSDEHHHHPNNQLARRHTEHNLAMAHAPARPSYGEARAHTLPKVDMDLAYGEFHPSALERIDPEPSDMSGLVGKVKGLLIEADCAHHSVTAIISHLQSNPDAMAAVALTLAELSKLVTDLGPTALKALRASAPAVFALLASPHFMIAAGVGIGVTVVMFGGYKIIKQISSRPEGEKESPVVVDELMEINTGMSRIEGWRRGVAESEAESVGTSVDGEFITPTAAAMSRVMLHECENDRMSEIRSGSRLLPAPTRVSSYVGGSVYETGSQASRRSHTSRSSRHSKSSKTSRSSSESKDRKTKDEKKDKEKKKKKPSPLRKLFS
ncbi:uncharacterized protein GIQ15_01880 [Arthroderma uncinatum]|uniref:uncharacterized protein n=1 Tax=Arthroderma uncinatum TaxID=74035 RepID=UPI00144ACD09|nr:uncharacterized protein GIQ15_01880 [Arthroderma uncinatum]KAF3492363.1 hypothetical protein GIQ15_01880 [Arthroderma uncinatum]